MHAVHLVFNDYIFLRVYVKFIGTFFAKHYGLRQV